MRPDSMPNDPKRDVWHENEIYVDSKLDYIHVFVMHHKKVYMTSHSFYKISIVIDGEGWLYAEDQIYKIENKGIMTIPPNVRNGYYSEKGMLIYNILIRPDFFIRYKEDIASLPGSSVLFEIEPYLRLNLQQNIFVTLSDEQLEELSTYMNQLKKLCAVSEPGLVSIKNALAILIIGYISKLHIDKRQNFAKDARDKTAEILYAMDYIHKHYNERLRIADLVKQSNMSRTVFCTEFSALNRCSVMQYLKDYRLNQAKNKLMNKDNSITSIAQECGFYDSSHFIKSFICKYGITPKQYKNSLD